MNTADQNTTNTINLVASSNAVEQNVVGSSTRTGFINKLVEVVI